ncbi:hypothetical protein B0H63DRAFT_519580 [Podospora didyma]|uniref:Uncharacterized protein n=1 Tax=Podospora didyma TaxID=330526 RepID=A0AAE0NZA5_9PEZI|nr:hypothetical protein B0H63DRAFT_519580 [Podospora didyma]
MAAPNHNHANYQARALIISNDCWEKFTASSEKEVSETKITTIQYETDFPFKYNNFVYRFSLPTNACISSGPHNGRPKSAGCVPIPTIYI